MNAEENVPGSAANTRFLPSCLAVAYYKSWPGQQYRFCNGLQCYGDAELFTASVS